MKKLKTAGFIIGLLAIAAGTLYVTFAYSGKFLDKSKPTDTVDCQNKKTNHTVTIQNNTMDPAHTDAALCDTLTITNNDDSLRLIAFGEHDSHIAYDGVSEKTLKKGESFTITLNKPGTVIFHDHNQDEVEGDFTVTN
jgi:plastocyanin